MRLIRCANAERFPEDFMFRLTAGEKAELVAKCDHLARPKFAKVFPVAFTEHEAILERRLVMV